jgi:conjugal transfer/type IV secretion protein DotA/TraY
MIPHGSDIARYTLMPEIIPRLKDFAPNGFWFASLMAQVFRLCRLLPVGHPMTLSVSYGRYGVKDVLSESARLLKFDIKHLDHIIIYLSFLLGIVLLLAMMAVIITMAVTHSASAGSVNTLFGSMFETARPQNDLALMMLDRTFQIPGFFGSSQAPASANDISAFMRGLQTLFEFYGMGMLCIAGLLVFYFFIAVILETAQSGSPFGERFAEVYVPIRLVIALLLLVPMGYGFSAGQYMVLNMAKWGSAFATNAWLVFNKASGPNPLGAPANELIAAPKASDIDPVVNQMFLTQSCIAIYDQLLGIKVEPYFARYSASGTTAVKFSGQSYEDARNFYMGQDIRFIFGTKIDDPKVAGSFPAQIKPYCGIINIQTPSRKPEAIAVYEIYYLLMGSLIQNTEIQAFGKRMALAYTKKADPCSIPVKGKWGTNCASAERPFYQDIALEYQAMLNALIKDQIDQLKSQGIRSGTVNMTQEILDMGWAGGGVWFNKIAGINGAITSAAQTLPQPASYPLVMDYVKNMKILGQLGIDSATQFTPETASGTTLDWTASKVTEHTSSNNQIAGFLSNVFQIFVTDSPTAKEKAQKSGGPIAGLFHMMFGTTGLMDLRENDAVHPLAKMAALGRGIIERTITYLGATSLLAGASSMFGAIQTSESMRELSAAAMSASNMFMSFALVGLTVGFILYYVIPFIPFLYFFFAAGRWVKSVFEALVGVPLWALAHIRIDGDGIPAQAAANGYYLLLEIMLRPIMTLFGLMAAFIIFTGMVIVLNSIFDLVLGNLVGFTPSTNSDGTLSKEGVATMRDSFDKFFYSVAYAVLLYMMAMACFKLIDLIPNSIMRFIGSQVSSFAEKEPPIADKMVQYTGVAGYSLSDDLAKVAQGFGKAAGEGASLPIAIKEQQDARQALANRQQNDELLKPPPSSNKNGQGGSE